VDGSICSGSSPEDRRGRRGSGSRRRGCAAGGRSRCSRSTTLRRLIGSSVVVGLASVSRRHEGPSRNGRQPTEREVEAAAVGGPATSQGGVWIRIASSRSSRRTPASALSLLPVWPGAPCGCWPTRRCCQVGTAPVGAIGPNFRRTLGRCRRRLESTSQAKSRYVRRLMLLVALRHLPAAPLLQCAVRWQTHQTARLRGRSPRLVA
jgi:hypothetical protein